MADNRKDFVTCWNPSKKEKENSRNAAPVAVRVTKTVLESGEEELLVSSLTEMESLSLEEMVKLYSMRWMVEEGIKNLKPKMKLEQFGCRKPEGVYREFHAHIFVMNMVALTRLAAVEHIGKKTKGRKREYQYNWQNAFRYVSDIVVEMFSKEKLDNLLDQLVARVSSSLTA